jgi:hypothetical protein
MPRAFLGALLLILSAGLAPGQSAEPPALIFPSDGKLPAEANGAELLQAVCPGQVEVGEKVGCGKQCPSFTGFSGIDLDWSLTSVTRGHFLSPTSDDAVLSVEGCEPHIENFGGTILLTRKFQGWAMEWYKAGVETALCHKVPLQDGREILVCIGGHGGQGLASTDLFIQDLLNPNGSLMADEGSDFFEAHDSTGTCGYDFEDQANPFPVVRAFIEKVVFPASQPGAGSTISVTASLGLRETTPEIAQACLHAKDGPEAFAPPVKSYHLDFVFDGHDYKPTPASAETARMFGSR